MARFDFGVAGWSVYEGVVLSRDWATFSKVPLLELSEIPGGFGGLVLVIKSRPSPKGYYASEAV